MANKQRKPVEQNPPTDEVEQDSTAVEETGGKQEEIVKAPSSSPTVSVPADVDSEAKSKKNKKRSKKKKAETSSAAAAVTSPKTTKKNKKLLVKEDSFIRDVIPKEKPTKKPVEQEQPPTPPTPPPPPSVAEEKEESGGTHEQEKLVFKAPTPSPAASPAMADSESVPETETQEKEETESKKRPLEEGSPSRDEDTKRVKTEEKTKTYFQRLWSEEDEIVLLREIITFGSDQLKDKSRFLESVKSKISFEFTLSQLGSKIETLKRKFREKKHKEVVVFKKPHDQIRFELSKQIWGSSEEDEKEKKMKTAHGGQGWFESSFLLGSVASSGLGEETAKELWSLVSVEKKEKLEEEFRLFVAGEVRSMMRKSSLVSGALSAIDEVAS